MLWTVGSIHGRSFVKWNVVMIWNTHCFNLEEVNHLYALWFPTMLKDGSKGSKETIYCSCVFVWVDKCLPVHVCQCGFVCTPQYGYVSVWLDVCLPVPVCGCAIVCTPQYGCVCVCESRGGTGEHDACTPVSTNGDWPFKFVCNCTKHDL